MYSKLSHKLNERGDLLLSLKEKGVYHMLRIIKCKLTTGYIFNLAYAD